MDTKLDIFLSKNKVTLIAAFALIFLAASYVYFYLKASMYGGSARSLVAMGAYSLTAFALLLFLSKRKTLNNELTAALAVFLLGIIFIAAWGPFKATDEPGHYLAAYRYSNTIMGQEALGQSIPMREEDKAFFEFWEQDTREPRNDTEELRERFSLICQKSNMTHYDSVYSFSPNKRPPQMHIVPALGLTIGRIAHLGAIPTYYLARLLSLCLFTCTVFFVLRLLPNYKRPVMVLCFLPITLELATSLSYDTPIIETSFLLFALCLNVSQKKTVARKRQLIGIALLTFLLVPMKTIYTLIAFFAVFLPQKTFASNKEAFAFRTAIVFVVLFSLVLINLPVLTGLASSNTASFNSSGYSTSADYAPSYTLEMALEDPAHAVNLLTSTFFDNSSRHIQGLFGGLMSWTNIVGPWYIVLVFFTVFCFSLYSDQRCAMATPSMRLLAVILFLLGCVAIYISMMIGWISVKETVIVGIQGRYFIPLLPLLIFAIVGNDKVHAPEFSTIMQILLFSNLYYCGWTLCHIAIG